MDPAQPGTGVLLLHGFGGEPASVLPWAEHLTAAGHDVMVPLLPGHGTTWQQMAKTTWEDWYGAAAEGLAQLRARHDLVFVGGLSLGGSLALRLAADRPDEVAGVMVVNAAVDMSRRGEWLTPILKHVVTSVPSGYDLKRPGVRESGYLRKSVKAGHSAMKAMRPLQAALPRITSPLVFFRSVEDHVVSDVSHELVMDRVSSADLTLHLLENSYHSATLDNDAPFIFEASAAFVSRVAASRTAPPR